MSPPAVIFREEEQTPQRRHVLKHLADRRETDCDNSRRVFYLRSLEFARNCHLIEVNGSSCPKNRQPPSSCRA
jgi:hypothetical protein